MTFLWYRTSHPFSSDHPFSFLEFFTTLDACIHECFTSCYPAFHISLRASSAFFPSQVFPHRAGDFSQPNVFFFPKISFYDVALPSDSLSCSGMAPRMPLGWFRFPNSRWHKIFLRYLFWLGAGASFSCPACPPGGEHRKSVAILSRVANFPVLPLKTPAGPFPFPSFVIGEEPNSSPQICLVSRLLFS